MRLVVLASDIVDLVGLVNDCEESPPGKAGFPLAMTLSRQSDS
jgi:hypothetical protein